MVIFSIFLILTSLLFIFGFTYIAPLFLIIYGGSILVLFFIIIQMNGITSYSSLWFSNFKFNYNQIKQKSLFKQFTYKILVKNYLNLFLYNSFIKNFNWLFICFLFLYTFWFIFMSCSKLLKICAKIAKKDSEIEELSNYVTYLYDNNFLNVINSNNLFDYNEYYTCSTYWALAPNNYFNDFLTNSRQTFGFFNQNIWSYFDTLEAKIPFTYLMYEWHNLMDIKRGIKSANDVITTFDYLPNAINSNYFKPSGNANYNIAQIISYTDFSNINLTSFLYSATITNGLNTLLIAFILLFTLFYSIKLLKTSYKIYK